MKFIDKFNRALLKGVPEKRSMNGGAFISVSVPFSFSHEGKKYYYRLQVEKSHPSMATFGYDKNSVELWDCYTRSMCYGSKIEIPDGITDISHIVSLSDQTDEEVDEVFNKYLGISKRWNLKII